MGFEPGTFFVTGGAGSLGGYSIRVGQNVTLTQISAREDENETAHNTSNYANSYVLRRGRTFEIEVNASRHYSETCHEIYLEAPPRV